MVVVEVVVAIYLTWMLQEKEGKTGKQEKQATQTPKGKKRGGKGRGHRSFRFLIGCEQYTITKVETLTLIVFL